MKEIKPISDLNATTTIPGSKSITHRAIIAAGLARGESLLKHFLECEDTLYTARTMKELGVGISVENENLRVSGTGGSLHPSLTQKSFFWETPEPPSVCFYP